MDKRTFTTALGTPVGNGLDGDTFWIVAEHGRSAGYVRNIEADPHVRVKIGAGWRDGVAHPMPDDDPRARQRAIGLRFNAAVVRAMGTELLTVRVDLSPARKNRAAPVANRTSARGPLLGVHDSVPARDHTTPQEHA